ncbi:MULTISPECIES: CPBP family intramembrane glutamic endopeptidase [unclassified Oceanobacter]|jgi:membrane protease YdiL (CAAX protease family)|uniref:CPBP family intramembrane glutamic endopeptidase n=1 Tax=unclassified Oceanobacter TaxID=2620260 RepID=UPI002735E7BC|nr:MULTISPECIES: CPBP family intramembrane glutamic endopeptidase [unclassified Oceanobacter]MDP2547853.1 CPBP family intramembrane metalloprotease [Oceanobacter sp. 4_MG-2023]MDP2608855.1 CPBP family intramembrane metalloprotease [Oceanobacter sp. 1_MG-2023]MDP2611903.1 CPBP family intramembrane metalloprotease [Oceanobacter sp. 2_MG-2023]
MPFNKGYSVTVWRWLTPGFVWQQLDCIDDEVRAEKAAYTLSDHQYERHRVWMVVGIACLCLTLVHYGKYSSNLEALIRWLDAGWSADGRWINDFMRSQYRSLYGYCWWGGIHLVGFIVIPMLTIKWLFKQRLGQYGWQWGEVHKHWPGYLFLALPIMGFAVIASFGDDFSRHYPFYQQAHRSGLDLLSWELIYITQFVAVEFFFRGYLVNGLRRQFGSLSVAVMCLPYLMLHFPKLWPESLGAILFGFFLGILALMSRSIWGGVAVHVAIALTMDLAALIQTRGLPDHW